MREAEDSSDGKKLYWNKTKGNKNGHRRSKMRVTKKSKGF